MSNETKQFEWTDELVCEIVSLCLNKYILGEQKLVYPKDIQDFKQSKSIPLQHPETKYMNTVEAYNTGFQMGVRHCEKYGTGVPIPSSQQKYYSQSEVDTIREDAFQAGGSTGNAGIFKRNRSISDMWSFPFYKDYLQSISENKPTPIPQGSKVGWEIVTAKSKNGDIHDFIPEGNKKGSVPCFEMEEPCKAFSVRRISDNEVFSVGEDVSYINDIKEILSWSIREDGMIYAEMLEDIFFPITRLNKVLNNSTPQGSKEGWEIQKKPIIGYPNYEVYSNGEVFSVKKGKFLKKCKDGGYYKVGLSDNGIQKMHTIHRLVAVHFKDNPKNKPCVNHLDGDKLNNNDWNLEWAEYSENNQHAFDTGLRVWEDSSRFKVSKTMGGNPFVAKRAAKIVGVYYTLHECEKDLFVHNSNISKCLNGKLNQCNGYEFEYVTKEAAEQYILENKPCLSLNEVMQFVEPASHPSEENFREYDLRDYLKKKLNQ